MHSKGPLQPDCCALGAWQKPQAQNQGGWKPDGSMKPKRRRPNFLSHQKCRNDEVAHNHDGEIGRCVIGPLVMQGRVTMSAVIHNTEIGFEKLAFAASRTAVAKTAPHRFCPRLVSEFVHFKVLRLSWPKANPATRRSDTLALLEFRFKHLRPARPLWFFT